MPVDAGFPASMVIGPWSISQDDVVEYLTVIGDDAAVYTGLNAVPPALIAILALRRFLVDSALPPGVVHISQTLKCHRPCEPRKELFCDLAIRRTVLSGVRGAAELVVAKFSVRDESNTVYISGETGIAIPDPEGQVML